MSASTADRPVSARGGWLLKSARGGPLRRGLYYTVTEQPREPSILVAFGVTCHRFQPRHGTPAIDDETGEPPLRLSIKALRLFLASVTLARFIWSE